MKSLFYSLMILFVAFATISCEDKEESNFVGMAGVYEKPHFEFEYSTDSVTIQMMPGQKKSIAVEDLKGMFLGMATEKMGAYFQGIKFTTESDLLIEAKMQNGSSMSMPAVYSQTSSHIKITLDPDMMAKMMGEGATNIPPISFRYNISGKQMTMYFDKEYVAVMYAMMEDRIVPMVVEMMGIDFSKLPAGMEEQVTAGIKQQISGILNQIKVLEIGFVLDISGQAK